MPKVKKIIAQEGLIFLGFLFLGIMAGMIFRDTKYSSLRLLYGYSYKVFSFKNMLITFSGYTVYLSIRFISWAVRTLGEMNMNIKKIIAREGLILIGVILLSCLIFSIASIYPPYQRPPIDLLTRPTPSFVPDDTPEQARAKFMADLIRVKVRWGGPSILFIAYALYLIPSKFIIWAVRILRGETK